MSNVSAMDSERSDEVIDVNTPCGVPRAILTCRQNSHPFQERVLNLDQAVKIGRSVARTRASVTNGIFDCKVLSRNHAVMWFENEKFYIQDTKSSNGTFVNSQRLSRGAEDSPPRELWSGDVLQFGVDVLENQRKGNEESDSCDDSVHIVTHGCIVATVKLIYPNGKEAKPSSISSTQSAYPQEDINTLQLILHEALQREERLHNKLEELEGIVLGIQESSRDALNHRFEESRLLSKIAALDKRIKILNKIKAGDAAEADMIAQLLCELEKVQEASRANQERLHKDLITTEDSLTEARREASNSQLEIQALKDASKLNEIKIQELMEKCSGYTSTIENLETMLKTINKDKVELEVRIEGLQVREEMLQKLLAHPLGKVIYEHLLLEDGYESLREPGANVDKVVGEWYDRFFPVLKDHVNEEDAWKLVRRLLETIFADMAQSRRESEALALKKEALRRKIADIRILDHPIYHLSDKPEIFSDDAFIQVHNDSDEVIAMERELKEMDDHLWEAMMKREAFETRCRKMKVDLDSAMNAGEGGEINQEKTDPDQPQTFTVDHLRQLVDTFSSEDEKGDDNYEKFILPKKQDDSTQTEKVSVATKETSTNALNVSVEEIRPIVEAVKSVIDSDIESHVEPGLRVGDVAASPNSINSADERLSTNDCNAISKADSIEEELSSDSPSVSQDISEVKILGREEDGFTQSPTPKVSDVSRRLDVLMHAGETQPEALSLWEKIRQIYIVCDETLSETPIADKKLSSIRELINAVSEDMVTLLVHDRKREEERKQLEERLSQSLSQADVAALTFAMDLKTIFIVSLIAFGIYFLLSLVFEI